ncbi:MAG: PKD domain-containing protein, partial [Anaerolineales bacterium]|nr:PKD domain-containing protein [Anaerolineales bacterium]
DQGATDTATVTITVTDPNANQPPTAVATADITSGVAPLAVNFDGSGSSDSDGAISSYAWDFGDGNSSTAVSPSHTYTTAGTYVVTLTVTDDQGATGTDSVTITVLPDTAVCTSNCLQVSQITMSSRDRRGSLTISGQVRIVDENGNRLDGVTVYGTWTLPNGTTETQVLTTNVRGSATFTTTDGGAGTYTLVITNVEKSGYTFDPDNSILIGTITP